MASAPHCRELESTPPPVSAVMEGGTDAVLAAAFSSLHAAPSSAARMASGSNLDELDRSVIHVLCPGLRSVDVLGMERTGLHVHCLLFAFLSVGIE